MNEIDSTITALEKITTNTDSTYDWDDSMSVRCEDNRAEAVRQLCWLVSEAFPLKTPPNQSVWYCSPEGMDVLKAILAALKKDQRSN